MAMTRKRLLRIGFYGATGLIFLYVLLDSYSRQYPDKDCERKP